MPIRRRTSKPRRRVIRRTKRRAIRRARKPKLSMTWHHSPFGRTFKTQITYAENITITSTAGIPYNYLFSVNGLYDPNITGTGTQPRYFDTLCGANNSNAPFYNYRVLGSRISIEAMPTGSDAMTMRGFVGIGLYNTTASGPTTLMELRERQDYKIKYMGYWYSNNSMCRIARKSGSLAKLFGVKDIMDNVNTAGDYGSNPGTEARWAITFVPFDESSTRSISCLVKIIYDVVFFNRNDVANS